MKSFLIALQFLTIFPVRVWGVVTERDMARSAAFFPLVGLVQGLVLVAVDAILGRVFHPDLVAALVLLALVLSNGGFHLDGLADTFDALATRGDRERKLSAMKDSATGAMGVTAIVFALAVKYLALRSLSNLSLFTFYYSLLLMPVLSKWLMLTGMLHGRPARDKGLGRIFMEGVGSGTYLLGTALVGLTLTAPVLLFSGDAPLRWHVFNAGVLGAFYLGGRLIHGFYDRRFGGLTGDTLGAAGELGETAFLLLVLVWSGNFI